MKRRLSFVLMIAMLLSMVPHYATAEEAAPITAEEATPITVESPSFAAANGWDGTVASGFAGGSGTAADPFYISNARELAYLAKSVNSGNNYSGKYIELISNIDISGSEWTPIGNTVSTAFYGDFRGNGYTISGLQIKTTTSTNPSGLFGTNYGKISDLNVSNAVIYKNFTDIKSQIYDIDSSDYSIGARVTGVGIVAGANYGNIQFVNVTGTIRTQYDITATVGFYWLSLYVGGVVGINVSAISDSTYNGTIDPTSTGVGGVGAGGICGYGKEGSVVTNSCSFGNISITDTFDRSYVYFVGGLIGASQSDMVKQCYSYMSIKSSTYFDDIVIGGLIGKCYYTTVDSCYAAGEVDATETSGDISVTLRAGGLIGETIHATVNNCYTENPLVKMWFNGDNGTTVSKLIALQTKSDGSTDKETQVSNCYVSGSTKIVGKVREGTGCDTKYVESSESSCTEFFTDGFVISADTLSKTLGWGVYTSLANTKSNTKNVWKFQNGRPYLYTELIHSLTIRYYNEVDKLFDVYFSYYDPSVTYSVESPKVSGSAATPETVSGTIKSDTFVDVHYSHEHIGGDAATCINTQNCILCGIVMAPKRPHSYVVATVVAPTCTQNGYNINECSVCGDTYNDSFTAPEGHQLDSKYQCIICEQQFGSPINDYTLYVYDVETNKPIDGAEVTLDGHTVKTDATGAAKFQLLSFEETTLSILAATYPSMHEKNYIPSLFGLDYIYLTSTESDIYGAWCNGDNVINGDSQLNAKAHLLTAKIVVHGRAKANILRYELIQGSKIIETSTDGVFKVYNGLFTVGEDVKVRMYTDGTDGHNIFERKLNIKVVGYIFNFETDLKDFLPFADGLKVTFPEGTPVFAGFKFQIPNPFLKTTNISYRHENDKIMIFFGFEHDYAKDSSLEDMTPTEIFEKALDDWASETKNSKSTEVSGSFVFIIEFSEAGVTKAYGQINVGIDMSFAKGKTFWVGVAPIIIPVYGEIACSLEGELEVTIIGYDMENAKILIPAYEITIGGSVTLYGGLGCHVASVGVYGEAGAEVVFSSDQDSFFERLTIYGELGLYAKLRLLFFKELCYKYPLIHGEFTWPDHTQKARMMLYSISAYNDDLREYLINRSGWLNIALLSDDLSSYSLLQESTYTSIEPEIITCGDTIMMVFMDDDGSEGLNYQHLYYSLYDKTTQAWSVPKRVDSNNNPDVEFDVYSDGEKIYIAYAETDVISEEDQDDVAKILSTTEIISAEYDFTTDSFINHTNLSSNDSFDTMPKISGTSNGIAVSWVNNFTNELFSQNANNIIMMSVLTDGKWQDANGVTDRGATIVSMDIGMLNGVEYVAAVYDVDCDLSTIDDRIVCLIDFNGNVKQINTETNDNDGVQFVKMQGKDHLVWYNNGNLYLIDGASSRPEPIMESSLNDLSANYKFLQIDNNNSVVLFTRNERAEDENGNTVNGSNVYGIFYSDGIWGNPIQITHNEAGHYVDAFAACVCDGKLLIPYVSADVTITENDIVKTSKFLSASLTLQNDLVVGKTEYTYSELIKGSTVKLQIPVINNSWQKLNLVSYSVKDSFGNVIFSGTQGFDGNASINSGETGYLTVELPKSLLTTGENYIVYITPEDWVDSDNSNNSDMLNLWFTDFSVDASQMLTPDGLQIRYTISNNGNICGDAEIKIYKYAEDGSVIELHSEDISALGVGNSVYGFATVNSEYYSDGSERGTVFVSVTSKNNELYTYNDSMSLSVGGIEKNYTTEVETPGVIYEIPQVIVPFVSYDKKTGTDIYSTITENGFSFINISEIPLGSYSYSNGVLTINNDYLRTLDEGVYFYTLNYTKSEQAVSVTLVVDVNNTSYSSVEITADNQTAKYDGSPLILNVDIVYSTPSQGIVSAEYSIDEGLTWVNGLPTNIGVYTVRLTVAEDDINRYLSTSCVFVLTIEKGTRAISVPKVGDVVNNQLLFGSSIPTAGADDGVIMYGYSTINDVATVTEWQETGILPKVDSESTYYIFAKISNGQQYEDAFSLGFPVNAHVHDWNITVTPSTCEKNGYTTHTCRSCGYSFVDSETNALRHDITQIPAKAATCTEIGWNAYEKCSRCNYTTYVEIPALKHNITQVSAKAATCTEIGWNAYEKCSRCNYTTYVEIPALKHNITQVSAKAATCTEIGWNAYESCSRCSYTTYVEIPALKHNLTQVSSKAATCTEIGWNAYEKCSRCSYTTYVEIPRLQHLFSTQLVKPQFGIQGYTLYTCSICGYMYKDNYTNALTYLPGDIDGNGRVEREDAETLLKYITGHNVFVVELALDVNEDGDVNIRDAATILLYLCEHELTKQALIHATCTSAGRVEHWACTKCLRLFKDANGIILLTEAATIIPRLEHTVVDDPAVTPTCTKEGNTEGKHCSSCNAVIVEQIPIPAKGHTEVSDAAVAPTCTTIGWTEGKHCSVCDVTLVSKVFLLPLGHTVVIDEAVASTCTAAGKTEGKHCSVCNTVIVAQSGVPSIGHSMLNGSCTMCNINASQGLYFYLNEDGRSYSVLSLGDCTDVDILIPDIYNGLPVTSIGSVAFWNCLNISSVTIPNSVTNIGASAFDYCISLESVTIPNSITSIGDYAFRGCVKLANVTLPNGITSIGESVFEGCDNLTSIIIPESVTNIGGFAFAACINLESVFIPNSVTSIGTCAFTLCTSLVNITIPNSVTSMGDFVFRNCCSLISVTIPNSVTSIGELPFDGCSRLKDIYYIGTEAEWRALRITTKDYNVLNATIHFNS